MSSQATVLADRPVTRRPITRRAVAAPIAAGLGAALVGGALLVVDPSERTVLPPCPFHAVTGLWCPGCGMTRATYSLLHGDLHAAFGYNVLVPVAIVALAYGWWVWLRTSLGSAQTGAWMRRVPEVVWIAAGVAIGLFGVLRNVPRFEYLAP